MTRLFAALLVTISAFSAAPVEARSPSHHVYTKQAEPGEADLTTHKHYTNKAGQDVHSPAKSKSGKAPAGASAQCRDGSYSFSKSHRGTCSHHGGVAAWR